VSTLAEDTRQDGALLLLALWKIGATGLHTAKVLQAALPGTANTSLLTAVFGEQGGKYFLKTGAHSARSRKT
jgi:hypothetical protein